MARYIMEEMPDIQKTGKRITYPKFARIDNASIKELAQRVGDVSGFSAGDIEGVLLQTAIEMAHLMAEGRSVKIDGIGTFTPALALCRDKERETLMKDAGWKELHGNHNVPQKSSHRSNGWH